MSEWTEGIRVFNPDHKIQYQNVCQDKRGVEHHVDVINGHLYHYIRSSRPVDGSWILTDPVKISETKVRGTPKIYLSSDGYLQIWASRKRKGKVRFWANPIDFPDPAAPMFIVMDRKIYYRGKRIIFVGNSSRQILHIAKGYWEGNGMDEYREYMDRVKSSGQNYVRHDAVDDPEFVRDHCVELLNEGIFPEITLGDQDREYFGNYQDIVTVLLGLPVFLEVENEFLSDEYWVYVAKERARYIHDKGGFATGGGWGYSEYGQENSKKFHEICPYHKAAIVHRGPYPPMDPLLDEIRKWAKEKPVLCNELLYNLENYPSVPESEVEAYVRAMILDAGACGVNIYRDEYELAGRLAKEFNP
jgi:hypothetical protein